MPSAFFVRGMLPLKKLNAFWRLYPYELLVISLSPASVSSARHSSRFRK